MKLGKFALLALCFISLNAQKSSDELFDKISQQRVGLSDEKLKAIKNPFIQVKSDSNLTQEGGDVATSGDILIKAIVSSRVKINEKWYKVDDEVSGLTITKISPNSIEVKNSEGKIEEKSITRKNANVTFSK
ncbi:hypothetical protein [Campylobacter gastrosuis]|uniref:Uncharacterized protein n=1 Tax=Campylobacter gastrosuis TaxID=2974576 RepID=A0ABT7HNB4_9BACT|nr:hypothetical protein [Campylobacter gastrosuis]MDL0088393.1 hypothetical protein [Campylobacter gastrosuis]